MDIGIYNSTINNLNIRIKSIRKLDIKHVKIDNFDCNIYSGEDFHIRFSHLGWYSDYWVDGSYEPLAQIGRSKTPFSEIIISNSEFSNNSATAAGGGIYSLWNDSTDIHNSHFLDNYSASNGGAGIASTAVLTTITDSTFIGNTTGHAGGAIQARSFSARFVITDNVFEYNEAEDRGGAIDMIGIASIRRNTFDGEHCAIVGRCGPRGRLNRDLLANREPILPPISGITEYFVRTRSDHIEPHHRITGEARLDGIHRIRLNELNLWIEFRARRQVEHTRQVRRRERHVVGDSQNGGLYVPRDVDVLRRRAHAMDPKRVRRLARS